MDLFYPQALSLLIRHAWDTVDLFYPQAIGHLIRHAWDTVDLFYPRARSRLIRHAWDTVDLFYPRARSLFIRPAWDTVDLFSPGSLVTSYDLPGIQWTYSIPGPLVTSYDLPGIQWTYSIPGPLVLYNHHIILLRIEVNIDKIYVHVLRLLAVDTFDKDCRIYLLELVFLAHIISYNGKGSNHGVLLFQAEIWKLLNPRQCRKRRSKGGVVNVVASVAGSGTNQKMTWHRNGLKRTRATASADAIVVVLTFVIAVATFASLISASSASSSSV